ncbi:penicillin acylase family protein [Roseivirga misakiensis]|uniref:Penicillin acylase n=1 Tax=Roseivirga misakiensis TaxID=1563681 RepID=A0A1E5T1R1_9BACT|nr:penicillin acylase family protein [Roseivirga misakiensis]OEK05237.1 penicillin acylase [Roseivirga misakiensis]
MKLVKLFVSLIFTIGIFYALNTKFGSIPPLGKFLSPSTGIWQNEGSDNESGKTFELKGLSAPVNVHYDENLIPHVFAQNDRDLYRAQGYITAQHRLWQMEFQTHASGGRLSEVVGSAALEYDRGQRRKGMVFGAENAIKAMSDYPELIKNLEAYRDGVNSYISSLSPEEYPLEYKLLDYQPEPWTLKKTALLLMYMTDMLAGGDSDFEYTNFLKKYGQERFDFIFPDFFDFNDPVIPTSRDWSDFGEVEVPEVPEANTPSSLLTDLLPKPNPDNGSNNWAVGPEKSSTGNPILANDPHLQLNLPSIWYAMQLATPEKNTFGVTLPGAAGIVIGFNNDISWGVTNATRDVKDWYKITFKDDSQDEYWYNNAWARTNKKIEEIKLRDGETFYDTVVYTHHGPVTYDASFKGEEGQNGFAMKWAGHLGGNNQLTLLELNKAKNYEEYEEALKHFVAPAQNFVFASREGDIALWVQGRLPNKWEGQGKFLLDGSNIDHDWRGFIPQEHNAHVKNPARGFVSSANQHPTDSTYPYYVFNDGYEAYRNRVINDFFRSKEKFDFQDFKDLHNNNYNLKAAELLPHMIANMDISQLNPQEEELFSEVKDWDYMNDIDQKGATIWERWWIRVRNLVWDELNDDPKPMPYPFTYQTIYLLKNHPNDPFMDIQETSEVETAPDLFLKAFKQAAEDISNWKKNNDDYNWGSYKSTYVGHILQALPALSRFNLPIGGNSGIVNATRRNHGPSWRMIVEMADTPFGLGIYPGGQSGNPGSKHYDDFVDKWAAGEYLKLLFMQNENQNEEIVFTHNLNPKQ